MSKKMEEVRDAGMRVVSEDFLTDIKSSGKALRELLSLHGISPWGAEVKLEAQASSAAPKSSGASKSSGRGKEDEGQSRGFISHASRVRLEGFECHRSARISP